MKSGALGLAARSGTGTNNNLLVGPGSTTFRREARLFHLKVNPPVLMTRLTGWRLVASAPLPRCLFPVFPYKLAWLNCRLLPLTVEVELGVSCNRVVVLLKSKTGLVCSLYIYPSPDGVL